ncbi:hypothetical protein ANN_09796 [Periplaneta americana]|uniref:Craniofacial development protein 2-like n=1 Tax=Periplaneta americana TaxID=6978 RepID=A0ABQ8TNA9_PERAM|nr:hypothetical protein ANN_09796 [Periplaneta americana]
MPSTWPGIEPATLGIEGQRYTNLPTRSTFKKRLGVGLWVDNSIPEIFNVEKPKEASRTDHRRRLGKRNKGFLIHKKVKSNIIDFQPINEHICSIRIKGRLFTTILSVHTPIEEKDEIVKHAFYERLDRVHQQIPKHDIIIILGDMNVKIGKTSVVSNVGRYTLHDISNANGERLCDFAVAKYLFISSTRFPHRIYTYKHGYHLMALQLIKLITS